MEEKAQENYLLPSQEENAYTEKTVLGHGNTQKNRDRSPYAIFGYKV
jgi:hypothetical protein